MNQMKSLWASVQNDPSLMRRVNGWLTILWIVMIPVSYYAGWLDSVTYVSALSLWALVSGHWSAWQAARVEVRQEAEFKAAADQDLAGEIVDRIVDETSLDASETPAERGASSAPGAHACPHCGHVETVGLSPVSRPAKSAPAPSPAPTTRAATAGMPLDAA